MIDSGLDRASELSARQNAMAAARRAFKAQPRPDRQARLGRLTAEEAAARRAAQSAQTGTLTVGGGSAATIQQPAPAAPPADPDAALRTGVRGVLAVAVLILLFLWVRQRRGG